MKLLGKIVGSAVLLFLLISSYTFWHVAIKTGAFSSCSGNPLCIFVNEADIFFSMVALLVALILPVVIYVIGWIFMRYTISSLFSISNDWYQVPQFIFNLILLVLLFVWPVGLPILLVCWTIYWLVYIIKEVLSRVDSWAEDFVDWVIHLGPTGKDTNTN